MALLGILTYPDPRLLELSQAVEQFDAELHRLLDDMAETMYQAPGVGLAAPQVNVHRRLIVVDVSEQRDALQEFINPELVATDGSQECEEGCLSVPGIYANVTRAEHIRVRARNRHGEAFEHEASGLEAVCIQHEIDHLDGKVFVDYLSPLKQERIRKKLQKQARQSM
ncbi:MAG: peptide deformylase [Gammaproteobacteria bacterium]|nr:peptide deformylase [Gammaproteobacteria bacterium]